MESCSDESGDVGQMDVDDDGMPQNEIDPNVCRRMIAYAVVKHDLPQSLVEYEGFRALNTCLNPDAPCFSRDDIVSEINKLYRKEKAKLKQVFANIEHRVCLTVDVWTACPDKCYICLAARFVDENWKLNCKILNFVRVDSPSIEGIDLAAKIGDFLMEWGIHGKVFSLTTDNDTMQDILKKRLLLDNNLLSGGEFFHGRCLADTLNLIVQNGLQLCADVLFKIRKSVSYLRFVEARRKRFADCVSQFSDIDTSVDLRLDDGTSWNLTYLMLDSAIKYKKAFASFRLVEQKYEQFCPTNEEWSRAEKLCKFLNPFYGIYTLIRNSSTSNLYFAQVWSIEKLLKENLSNEDLMIISLFGSAIEKLDKYWNEYSMMLAFASILDPRVKLQMFEQLYSKVESDSSKCQEKVSLVKSKLYKLFDDYANAGKTRSPRCQSSMPSIDCEDIYDEYLKYQRQLDAGKSQLDLYLAEPILRYSLYKKMDVLEYWKNHSYEWPDLALMACDVLAFPITTAISESGFSIGAHLLTKYKDCAVPKNIQDLICTRSWLFGFVSNDDEIEDYLRTKTTLPDEGSNNWKSGDFDDDW